MKDDDSDDDKDWMANKLKFVKHMDDRFRTEDTMVTLDPLRNKDPSKAESVNAKIAARKKPGQDLRGLS